MNRSGKEWFKNEREVMGLLGLKQVPGSGNGWVSKEDGENEHVLCQLKSTDATSIRVQKLDIDKLILHAMTSHKLPVFAIQFMESDEVFLILRPQDVTRASEYLSTGIFIDDDDLWPQIESGSFSGQPRVNMVKSSGNAREEYHKKKQAMYEKKSRKDAT